MSGCSLHVGDVGARIGLHFVECCSGGQRTRDLDVSDAVLTFLFRDSEGDVTEVTSIVAADFDDAREDMTDGKVMYVTVPGFLVAEGWMEVQGHAEWESGARRHSTSVERFHVGAKLGAEVSLVTWENGDLMAWENGDLIAWENGT